MEGGLRLTPGVVFDGYSCTCIGLGLQIPCGEPGWRRLMLDLGLASEVSRFGSGWLSLLLLPRSRALVLDNSAFVASAQSLGHNLFGMARWFAASALLCIAGVYLELPSIVALGVFFAMFLCSLLVHELGHVVAFRAVAPRGAHGILVSDGLKCHLVRRVCSRRVERLVVLSGPVAPAVITVVLVGFTPETPWMLGMWLVLCMGHLLTLALPVGDGANFRLTLG